MVRISGSFTERNSTRIHMKQHSYTESSFKILPNEWVALTITNLFMFARKLTRPLYPAFTFWMNSKPFRFRTALLTSPCCLQSQSNFLGVPVHLPAHEPIFQPLTRSLLSCTSYVLWQAFLHQIQLLYLKTWPKWWSFCYFGNQSQGAYFLHHQAIGWEFERGKKEQYLALPKNPIFHSLQEQSDSQTLKGSVCKPQIFQFFPEDFYAYPLSFAKDLSEQSSLTG